MRDSGGRGCAFEIDEVKGEALVFGTASPFRVAAAGVMPAHFVVLPHDGKLMAASASTTTPAILNGSPLPTTWTILVVPSRIRVGDAAVDFFYVRESGVVLVDQDIETTVAHPGASRPIETVSAVSDATRVGTAAKRGIVTPARPLPPLLPPPMRNAQRVAVPRNPAVSITEEIETQTAPNLAFAGPSTSGVRVSEPRRDAMLRARDFIARSGTTLRGHWESASMSTRVLLGVVAVLVVFLVARSGQEPRPSPAIADDAGARPSPSAPIVTPVPVPMPAPPPPAASAN